MKVKLRMERQTAETLLEALEILFQEWPVPAPESMVEVEILATEVFALTSDRPENWTIWR